jgi:REP element-mobilizing transposase RayT
MPRRTTPLLAGYNYHIFNRRHNKANIFIEPENYVFFLKRLRQYLKPSERVEILAYCLMPNHTHLLLRPLDDDLSRHMQKFSISYAKVMNKRYSKVGGLFQGSFQAKLIERDE